MVIKQNISSDQRKQNACNCLSPAVSTEWE